MSAERRAGSVLVQILAVAALAVVLRYKFIDLLTKTTGTWVGGVESPSPKGRGAD